MKNLTPMQNVSSVILDTNKSHFEIWKTLFDQRESLIKNEKQLIFEFVEWLEKLPANKKVSVWSKDGSTQGLFSMDTEQLYDVFLRELQ